MKRYALLAAIALLPMAACSSNPPPPTPMAAPAPPPLAAADTAFINSAAQAGLAEVQFGQLAATQATNPAVKKFASDMVTAHTNMNNQLMQLAQSKGVTPPTTIDSDHQTMLDSLSKMHGRAFDRAYLQGQVKDHQATLTLFQNEASQGTDADLKQFASQGAPVVQQHLTTARRLLARGR